MRHSCFRSVISSSVALCALLWGTLLTGDSARAARIEAVKGKQYRLSKRHGPWMIMVASFRTPPPEARTEGMTPKEAADALVYELRRKGIPAYAFSQDDAEDRLNTVDRYGRARSAAFTAQQGSICVLAGNYPSADDKVAQRTLAYVKKFHPQFLRGVKHERQTSGGLIEQLKNGGIYRKTPGRPGPLSGSFLTINPLLTPEEAAARRRDPLLLKLNAGSKFNLLDNPGQYTLVVATSFVKSTTTSGSRQYLDALKNFQVSQHLDETARGAWQLAKTLREGKVPFNNGNPGQVVQRNFEAYVFHDRHGSIVTIGSFDSPNDPRIAELKKIFGAKVRTNPQTGREALVAEVITLPDPGNRGASLRSWIFDPTPKLIKVPKLR